jgi:hypothetical protein
MSRLFGWDLPPGCSHQDIERAMGGDEREPTVFEDNLYEVLDSSQRLSQETIDKVFEQVGKLVEAHLELQSLLTSARDRLPVDSPLVCTCTKTAEYSWCDLHDGDPHPTLREEIEEALNRTDRLLKQT